MRIAATNKMVAALNRAAREAGKSFKFVYATMDTGAYAWNVGDIWTAYDYGDYNASTGKMRAVRVSYPCDYYAMPRYISTAELNDIYEVGDTLAGYISRVLDWVTI